MLTLEQMEAELKHNMDAQVYYDPRTKVLFTVRRKENGKVVIGGVMSGYYNDAITGLSRYAISEQYFNQCMPITRDSKYLEADEVGYKVKGYDSIKNCFWYKNVLGNPEFEYLPETDQLVEYYNSKYNLGDLYDDEEVQP